MTTLTIKINDSQNIDSLIEILSKFAFVEEIKKIPEQEEVKMAAGTSHIRKAKGKPSISDFAGLWQQSPKTLEQIREKAWKRTM
jgi:hypothetical protein